MTAIAMSQGCMRSAHCPLKPRKCHRHARARRGHPRLWLPLKQGVDIGERSDAGSIINIGGLTGAMGAPDRAHVVTAKAGIAGFTRALAMELAPARITVNTIVPSMLARPGKPNEIPEHPVYRPLLGRAGWPNDIAPLARLLLGPGGRYITGQIINVSGGTYFNV